MLAVILFSLFLVFCKFDPFFWVSSIRVSLSGLEITIDNQKKLRKLDSVSSEDVYALMYFLFHFPFMQVVRAGLNADIAPDLVANQLNVRNGALVLLVHFPLLRVPINELPSTYVRCPELVMTNYVAVRLYSPKFPIWCYRFLVTVLPPRLVYFPPQGVLLVTSYLGI